MTTASTPPVRIDAASLHTALAQGAPLFDVLPKASYDEGHLPGAISLPFAELSGALTAGDPRLPAILEEPLVVYCGGPT